MPEFKDPEALLKYVAKLRGDHRSIRAEVATRMALGLMYANGRQWTSAQPTVSGGLVVDQLAEDWNPRSTEIRVVDNRIGPLFRRIAADTNATKIESQVTPPTYLKTFEAVDQAVVSQSILNALSEDVGMTRVARNASSLRWVTGCAIIQVRLSSKRRQVDSNVLKGQDGLPIEVDDKWVRWSFCPLTDLIWDPSIISSDLEDHNELILEKTYTLKQFRQEYGEPSVYGIDEENLPRIEEIASYNVAAASLGGTSFFNSFAQNRDAPGIRVITAYFADPRDPVKWPIQYVIFDTSSDSDPERASGKVINFNNPQSPFGHNGLPLFKLDAFRRDDAVLPHGAPHVMMGDQDRLNLLESTQFQQLLNTVHGMWLVDTRSADRDTFVSDLNSGIGGVLRWDSRDGTTKAPEFVSPPPPNQVWIPMQASVALAMQGQVHISQQNLGQTKTHIPKDFQQRLLQESNTVVDNIIIRDVDTYSNCLKLTLSTVRKAMSGPSRMTARLRDRHGLKVEDLQVFLSLDPNNNPLIVRVRTASVTSRSIQERTQELLSGAQMGLISPKEVAIAMAEELERPLIEAHDRQLQFCHRSVRQIIAGAEWPGMPNLDHEIFQHTAEKAMFGMDILKPDERGAIARLQEAILMQKQLSLENQMPQDQSALDKRQTGGIQSSQPGGNSKGGAPGSIDPNSSPVGASGGLPLGLPASV